MKETKKVSDLFPFRFLKKMKDQSLGRKPCQRSKWTYNVSAHCAKQTDFDFIDGTQKSLISITLNCSQKITKAKF